MGTNGSQGGHHLIAWLGVKKKRRIKMVKDVPHLISKRKVRDGLLEVKKINKSKIAFGIAIKKL